MGWIIFAVILVIALFIGIGFVPKKVTIVVKEDGYYNRDLNEFIVGDEKPSHGYSSDWKFREKGTIIKDTLYGFHLQALQVLSLLAVLVVLFGMVKVVDANKVGIEYDPFNGGVQSQTLEEGIYFMAPWVKVYSIDTVQQELAFEEFSVQTEGSEFAWFVVEIKYKVNRVNAFEVFRNYQGLPTSSMIRQDVQDAVKSAAESYNIYDILGDQYADVKLDAETLLRTKLDAQGIDLITLNLVDIDAGADIEAKIVERGLAQQQQEIEQQLYEAALIAQQKETVEAETARLVEQQAADAELYQEQRVADAAAYLITAQADADLYAAQQEAAAIIALGEADAEAYQVVIEAFGSIEAYNAYILYTQWSGDVPQIVLGDSGVLPIWDLTGTIDDIVDPVEETPAE